METAVAGPTLGRRGRPSGTVSPLPPPPPPSQAQGVALALANWLLLMVRIDKCRLWEFSTKKYVLFTEYFMSSFQITWYFQRTLCIRTED